MAVLVALAAAPPVAAPLAAQQRDTAVRAVLDGPGNVVLHPPPTGSGTTWLPYAAREHRGAWWAGSVRGWSAMLHGTAFVQGVRNAGTRGHWQVGSANWLMAMADRRALGGELGLRAMLSAEAATLSAMGVPQLLQVAQPHRGGLLTDRQHPHEVVGELALRYDRIVRLRADRLGLHATRWFAYAAPAGEPAVGPVMYYHRPSAEHDPLAPLGHHVQDGAHTSFGVVTLGGSTERVQVEGSLFNGAHPDERRTGIDLRGARLDSWAARLTASPGAAWSLSVSAARISNAVRADAGGHAGHALGARRRLVASAMHVRPLAGGRWATTLVWGADRVAAGGPVLGSLLLETDRESGPHALFARAERVRRTSAELALTGSIPATVDVGALSAGYARTLATRRGIAATLGARGTINVVPDALREFYGSFTPLSGLAYVRLAPGRGGGGHGHH